MNAIKNMGLFVLTLMVHTITMGQPPHGEGPHGGNKERNEKIHAMKVEYITTQLALTPTEAEKFWPVYNEFGAKIKALERKKRKAHKASDGKELSDKEMNAIIQLNFDTDQEILDLRREYDLKFKKVLSIQKVGKLYRAELGFRHELLRKMKRGGPPPK